MLRHFAARCRAGIAIVFMFNTVLLIEHVVVLKQEKQGNSRNGFTAPVDTQRGRSQDRQSAQLMLKDVPDHIRAKIIYESNAGNHKLLLGGKGPEFLPGNNNELNRNNSNVSGLNNQQAVKEKPSRTNVTFIKLDRNGSVNRSKLLEAANKTAPPTMSPEELERMQKQYYRKQNNMVNQFNYRFLIKPSVGCSGDVFIAAFVHSKPDYHERRDAIRRTWGSLAKTSDNRWGQEIYNRKLAIIFVIGQSQQSKLNGYVEMESFYNGDILLGNFQDSYKNMTLKSLLGLKYASQYCKHVPYLLKSDDDMFIHIPQLTSILDNATLERSIMGPYNANSKVYRRGKWNISQNEFPFLFFPPYESGSAYIITMDIVPQLYDTSHYVPWLFIDDVYITGILGKILNVTHVKTSGLFAYWNDKAPKYCDVVLNRKIAMTKCTPKVMDLLWSYVFHGVFYVESCREKTLQDQQLEEEKAKRREQIQRLKAQRVQKANLT